jgi:hypothetical protein
MAQTETQPTGSGLSLGAEYLFAIPLILFQNRL